MTNAPWELMAKLSGPGNRGERRETTHIRCTPNTISWGYLDPQSSSIARVNRGSAVLIDTVSGGESRLPLDRGRFQVLTEHERILAACTPNLGPHILTGPIDIEGAVPGSLLKVSIGSVSLRQNWGWNEIAPGDGLLPELEGQTETLTIPIDMETGEVQLPWGPRLSASPFFGIMAVKPRPADGICSSVVPQYFGGNMDVRLLGIGAEIFFPVHCQGAGFFAGDGHALQGDGEIVGTAVETALTGEFRFDVLADVFGTEFPFARLPGALVTMGFNADLEIAAKSATRQAIRILTGSWQISERDAYRHISLMGNLSISQMVNVNKGVHLRVNTEQLKEQ